MNWLSYVPAYSAFRVNMFARADSGKENSYFVSFVFFVV